MCRCRPLPYVAKCCCYISLRTSAYLIGLLQSTFGLSVIVYAIADPSTVEDSVDLDAPDADLTVNLCITGIGFVLLGALLVLGVKIKMILLIRIYVISEMIGLLVGLIVYTMILINLFLAYVITSADKSNFVIDFIEIFAISSGPVLVLVIVTVFAAIALKTYLLICVNSYLKQLTKSESSEAEALTAGYTTLTEMDEIIKFS